MIQGSACVYSCKVEYLHTLVLQALAYVADKKCASCPPAFCALKPLGPRVRRLRPVLASSCAAKFPKLSVAAIWLLSAGFDGKRSWQE